jgi:hypothetical protein
MGDWRKSVYNYTVVAFASKINIITCEKKKKIYLNSGLFPVNRENYKL